MPYSSSSSRQLSKDKREAEAKLNDDDLTRSAHFSRSNVELCVQNLSSLVSKCNVSELNSILAVSACSY